MAVKRNGECFQTEKKIWELQLSISTRNTTEIINTYAMLVRIAPKNIKILRNLAEIEPHYAQSVIEKFHLPRSQGGIFMWNTCRAITEPYSSR